MPLEPKSSLEFLPFIGQGLSHSLILSPSGNRRWVSNFHLPASCFWHIHYSSGYFCSKPYPLHSLGPHLSVWGPASLLTTVTLCFTQCVPPDLLQGWRTVPLLSPAVALLLPCPDASQSVHSAAIASTCIIQDAGGSCSLHFHPERCHCLPAYLLHPKLCSTNRKRHHLSCIPLETPGIEFCIDSHVVLSLLVHRHSEGTVGTV